MREFSGFQKGVNLGGWISQFAKYDDEHFKTFITEKDIAFISSLGFDHVRVPVDYIVLEDELGVKRESGFRYLEKCREWCEKYGLNMLIDLHECYGYSFDPLKKDMDRKAFFYSEEFQGRFFSLWREIAEHFSLYQESVAFEPLNEVVLPEVADAWNEICSRYIKLIRSICPKTWIVIGGVNYNNVLSVPLISVPLDDRIVYNFHCYEPMVFTHQGAYWVEGMPLDFRVEYPKTLDAYRKISRELSPILAGAVFDPNIGEIGVDFFSDIFTPALKKAEKDDVPLYCGEYGVIDKAESKYKIKWLKDIHTALKKYGIGRALWNYKEKDFGFVDDSFSSVRKEFIEIL